MKLVTDNAIAAPRRPRLRRAEVPAYLLEHHGIELAYSSLEKMATNGGGPPMQYHGRIPLYPITELDAWAEARLGPMVRSTSGKA